MDYWLEILATRVRGTHFFHASLAEWYRDPKTHPLIFHNSFGSPGRRYRYNFSPRDWLVFPMCKDNHFHLLVGNVKLGRWEYYNSLNSVVDIHFLEFFTTFVASWLRDDGWPNPLSWKLVRIPNLPK